VKLQAEYTDQVQRPARFSKPGRSGLSSTFRFQGQPLCSRTPVTLTLSTPLKQPWSFQSNPWERSKPC